ncbi:hypothetical protein [Microcoleus sp. SVA1_A4]|uniref:hypothetical protein n=1 Tax=Microcoleus sp. SVA1_A4 TaxID=2818948 RepID=UPI002FD27511
MPCPYKSGDRSFCGRETALPCPPSHDRAMVISDRAIDHFVVGKRHCRVLHRPTGRWLYPIARSILRITQNQETAVPFPYKSRDG